MSFEGKKNYIWVFMGSQGGWGWLVVGAAFLVQVLTTGLQLAFGVMAAQIARHFRKENAAVHMEAGQLLFILFQLKLDCIVVVLRLQSTTRI